MKNGWKIICEDTRKHIIRLEYCVNLNGYWLYLNGYLVKRFEELDIDNAVIEFTILSSRWNGEAFYFLSDSDNKYTGETFELSDYITGIYPYNDIRKRLSVGSLMVLGVNKVV